MATDDRASCHPLSRPAPLRPAGLLRMRSGEFEPIVFIINSEPHPEEHRVSDASRRMATDDRASCHPSRRPASLPSAGLLRMRSGEFELIVFIINIHPAVWLA